jgi:lipid A 3-O-deacylase
MVQFPFNMKIVLLQIMQNKHRFRLCFAFSCLLFSFACNHQTKEIQKTETVGFVRSEISEQKKVVSDSIYKSESISSDIFPKSDSIIHQNISLIENIGQFLSPIQIPAKGQLAEVRNRNLTQNLEDESYSESLTSLNAYMILDFENDIFTNTDFYYTNGASITLILPTFRLLNVSRILPGLGYKAMNYYAIGLRQNMYTGLNPEYAEISYHDRPFAGFLAITFSRSSFLQDKQLKLTSGLTTGVLGSYSLAGAFQSGLHDLPPTGWTYQIDNDLIINISADMEKGLIARKNIDLSVGLLAQAGSLFTDLSGKIILRIGQFNPLYNGLPISRKGTIEHLSDLKFQYWFSISATEKWVVHNGTLQGGLFNHESPYTLDYNELNHFVNRIDANLNFYYGQNGIVLNFVQINPEFKEGRQHRWGGISLIHNL